MKRAKRIVAALLAGAMALAMAGCGSKSNASNENVDYAIIGNYVYESEDGSNVDANGVTWYLYIDAETKFHIVGIKQYDDAAPSIRIDEGQVVSVNGYTLDCNFTPYSAFTQYLQHGQNDEATTETVKSISQEAITAYQDKTGDEFFQIELNRTSNDATNSGTFKVLNNVDLGWGSWQ